MAEGDARIQIATMHPNLGVTLPIGANQGQIIPRFRPPTAPEGVEGTRVILRNPQGDVIEFQDAFYDHREDPAGVAIPHRHPKGNNDEELRFGRRERESSLDTVLRNLRNLSATNEILIGGGGEPVTRNQIDVFCSHAHAIDQLAVKVIVPKADWGTLGPVQ